MNNLLYLTNYEKYVIATVLMDFFYWLCNCK